MSLLGSIASIAAPILGGLIGGPAGASIGSLVGGAIASSSGSTQGGFAGVLGPSNPGYIGPAVMPGGVPVSSFVAANTVGMATLPRAAAAAGRTASGIIRGAGVATAVATRFLKPLLPPPGTWKTVRDIVTKPNGKLFKWGRAAATALGYIVVGDAIIDSVTGLIVGQVSHRRMNPLNHRALTRSIRRVKAAKHICSQVEKIAGGHRRRSSSRGVTQVCR